MTKKRFYHGKGHQDPQRAEELPVVDTKSLRDAEHYRASDALAAAVDVALTLGMPLLLTGEPGSGKSGAADSISWELGLGDEALRFVVKSDTESRDIFYRFDSIGRFHAAHTATATEPPDAANYLTFEALGRAILHASPSDYIRDLELPPSAVEHPGKPRRYVVLIDEIDKAAREVPNDILVEIERMQFDIPELSGGKRGTVRVTLDRADPKYRPIVVFTSNSERPLPDAFLRRCVYHHLEFPPFAYKSSEDDTTVTVETIVRARLGQRYLDDERVSGQIAQAIRFFQFLRDERRGLKRPPSLAELLDWLNCLTCQSIGTSDNSTLEVLTEKDLAPDDFGPELELRQSIASLLLKTPADQARAQALLNEWRNQRK